MKSMRYILLALLAATVLAGCFRENTGNTGPCTKGGLGNSEVTFLLTVPGESVPSTRSMDAKMENHIATADLIIFDVDSDGNRTYAYHTQAIRIENVAGGVTNQARMKATLTKADRQLVMILANCHDEVESALASISPGASKKEVLEALEFSKTTLWNANSAVSFDPIPMYSEVGPFNVAPGVTFGAYMIRMLARIDVNCDPAASDFGLQRIYLCNYMEKGRVAPYWYSNGEVHMGTAFTPNLGTDSDWGTQAGEKHLYYMSGTKYEGNIYAFESAAANDSADREDATCLVLEGYYDGRIYFYRVDFTVADADQTDDTKIRYMPILRNHKYVFTVEQALGIGYNSVAEAVASYTVPSNLKTRLIYHDQSILTDIVFNGQYMLGLEKPEMTISRDIQENSIRVFTDNPGGWKATVDPADVWWLSITGPTTGDANDISSVLKFKAAGPAPFARTGRIHITADRLSTTFTVKQGMDTNFSISVLDERGVDISGIAFAPDIVDVAQMASRKIYVVWTPADVDCVVTQTGVTTPAFQFSASSDKPAQDNGGVISGGGHMFAIQPVLAPLSLTYLNFKVTDSYGNTVNKTIELTQPISNFFAQSNIVVDRDNPGQLKFADNPNAQGLMFKFGSLVGVLGLGNNDLPVQNGPPRVAFRPTGYTGVPATLNDIPCIPDTYTEESDTSDEYLLVFGAAGFDESEARGDVCRYMTAKGWVPEGTKWRIPTCRDFQTLLTDQVYIPNVGQGYMWGTEAEWKTSLNDVIYDGVYGDYPIPAGWLAGYLITDNTWAPPAGTDMNVAAPAGTVFLPLSGDLGWHGGLSDFGTLGMYWSSSLYRRATDSTILGSVYNSYYKYTAGANGMPPSYACPVRCVRYE